CGRRHRGRGSIREPVPRVDRSGFASGPATPPSPFRRCLLTLFSPYLPHRLSLYAWDSCRAGGQSRSPCSFIRPKLAIRLLARKQTQNAERRIKNGVPLNSAFLILHSQVLHSSFLCLASSLPRCSI